MNGGPAGSQAGPDSEDEVPYETKGFDYGKYALVCLTYWCLCSYVDYSFSKGYNIGQF